MDNINPHIGNWFLDQLAIYQTANSDYQSVKNNFIIRKAEYEIIIDSIMSKKGSDPLQHELILGRRGSGKSTLLKRIEIEIVENAKLNKNYIAINLAEEQAGIYRLFDLWEQVIHELVKQHDYKIILPDYKSFNNDQAYTRQLYTLIHENCEQQKKRIILLLDNFDRIVENFTDDGSLLRETLINFNDLQIIAGSTRMDEHFWRYDMPFYDFFRSHKLEALSRAEMNTLLTHWSNLLHIEPLKNFVKNNPGKIENIRILTDGLPRTLQFFIQIVLQKQESSSYDYLKKTMDNISPLYQERLSSLTPQLRKIVYEMAFIWEACTTKQLVEKTKMESKLISANLKMLVVKGIVDKLETSKKQHLYRISERFFNMWLIITQGNPDQKRKAKWLSVFLENWYDANDFKQLTIDHIDNLKTGKKDWNNALLLSKGLSQSKYISVEDRDTIIELTENIKEKKLENCLIELPERYSEIEKKILSLIRIKNFKEALILTEQIENEDGGKKFLIIGTIYEEQDKWNEAIENYKKAFKNGNILALNLLSTIFNELKMYKDAEMFFKETADNDNFRTQFHLANLYVTLKKYELAESYYLRAIKNGEANAISNLATLYLSLEKYDEAEKYYLKGIKHQGATEFFNLATFYKKINKYNLAETYFIKAIDKGNIDAIYNLANLYYTKKEDDKAEVYYLKAIKKGNINALNNLAILYYENNKLKTKALEYITVAFDKNNTLRKANKLKIELWNGIFNDIENRAIEIIKTNTENITKVLIFDLLVQQQKTIVLNLFNNVDFGTDLKEKYAILYYVTLILNKVQDENLLLKIPPEIKETIEDVLAKIKTQQKMYGYL